MRGIYRWPVDSPHKVPVTRKMFPFDDVIKLTKKPPLRWSLGANKTYNQSVYRIWATNMYQAVILYLTCAKYVSKTTFQCINIRILAPGHSLFSAVHYHLVNNKSIDFALPSGTYCINHLFRRHNDTCLGSLVVMSLAIPWCLFVPRHDL